LSIVWIRFKWSPIIPAVWGYPTVAMPLFVFPQTTTAADNLQSTLLFSQALIYNIIFKKRYPNKIDCMIKRISLYVMAVFYVLAGINHFVNPAMYLALIPPYLPAPAAINLVSGAAEILLGLLLLPGYSRQFAAVGIIVLLVLFIPAHIYMIQLNGCVNAAMCIPLWATWLRLIPLQLVLMYWAWSNRR